MKIVLVSAKDLIKDTLGHYINQINDILIHYRNPLKAMDNLEEVTPDVVLFSAEDFPRHWKPFLVMYRQIKSREEGSFLLFTGDNFSFEEAAKAECLEVNAICNAELTDPHEIEKIKAVLFRHNKFPKAGLGGDIYIPSADDRIDFVFNHPQTITLITGKILGISLKEIRLKPDYPSFTQDLKKDDLVSNCSLTIGNELFSIDCCVTQNTLIIILRFIEPSIELTTALQTVIDTGCPTT